MQSSSWLLPILPTGWFLTTIVTIAMGTSEKDTWYLLEVGVGELKGGREPSSLPPNFMAWLEVY